MEVKQRVCEEGEIEKQEWVSFELPLGEAAESFDLESVVCSHGLFMMAPNRWDPLSKTLLRPLHLDPPQPSDSVMVRVTQPQHRPHSLHIGVYAGTRSLTPANQEALLAQVSRMLRLSENDERVAREFRAVYAAGEEEEEEEEEEEASVIGRVFRSPTLFEDMVKCILLCNCQWPRTLSMAEALCDLQLELQLKSLLHGKSEDFMPKTPAGREVEPKKKLQNSKASKCLAAQFAIETKVLESHSNEMSSVATAQNIRPSSLIDVPMDNGSFEELCKADSGLLCDPQLSRDAGFDRVGSFPTPVELAKLDENFLAKRCKLGYRARRIVNLAQGIVEGRIQLRQLEETCMERSLCSYKKLAEQLREIDGFGPFTCANVLMCMGFYHVIPTDSETIRHLKQVHAKESTTRTMEADVQNIYAKYAPFQFLAYWSELWNFYEKKFGKLSEMPSSAYKLITASNMRTKPRQQNKRKKTA